MNGQNKGQSEIMNVDIYLSLGSNMGDRIKNLTRAAEVIGHEVGMVVDQSSIYESEPWGKKDQAFFLNQVVKVRSALKAEALLVKIQEIEKKMGRIRKEQWGPRTIDIDILFYNSRIISEENLIIPHARAHERRFVIMPMAELSPSFVHPVLNQNMMVLSMTCIDMSKITKYKG